MRKIIEFIEFIFIGKSYLKSVVVNSNMNGNGFIIINMLSRIKTNKTSCRPDRYSYAYTVLCFPNK